VVADEIRDGAGAGRRASHGLRRSAVYGVVSLAAFALVLLGIPGATWNFVNPVGYISDIGWIWALSLLLIIGFAAVGYQSLRLAPQWLPLIVILLGLGIALRFAIGSEPIYLRVGLIIVGLVAAVVGVALAWRSRSRGGGVDVPPSVRPLLARTPLARVE
jgi:hypothetical protein